MAVDLSFFQSETSQQLRREGRDQGVIEGRNQGLIEGRDQGVIEERARCVVDILRERGVEVSDSDRARISSCKDEGQLDAWLRRAFTATSVDELRGGSEKVQPASSAG
jgi:hypothetical protein